MKLHFDKFAGDLIDIKPDKRTEVYNWGADNAFPSLITGLISISVTAKNCVDRVSKAIYGGGFGKMGLIKVDSAGTTLNDVYRNSTIEYAENNNVFLQVGYDLNYDFSSVKLITNHCGRIGKSDDKDYSGRYVVYNNWDKTKGKKIMSDQFQLVDVFNPNKDVIRGQMERDEKLGIAYKGQIIHIKNSPRFKYGVSDLYPVMEECLLEMNSKNFRARGSEKGFLNTKLLTVKPFGSDEERRSFKNELKNAQGADNASSVVLLETSSVVDEVEKALQMDDLSSKYNDKLFEYSDREAEKNICKALGVPLVLVNPNNDSMFGNSGELLREAKKEMFYSRSEDRDKLEEVFKMIMAGFANPVNGLSVLNPYEELNIIEND